MPRLPAALMTTVLKNASPVSASVIESWPDTLSLPLETPTSSVTPFGPALPITAASFAPLMVMVTSCEAVPPLPSETVTVDTSTIFAPAGR